MGLPAISASPRVARLTASQVHAMLNAGILKDAAPLELIEGLLVYKDRSATGGDPTTIGERHNLVIKLLNELDAELRSQGMHVQTQGPLRISELSEPEPDAAIVRGAPRDYLEQLPAAADVASVIEVADSSLEDDRLTKAELYAKAGIPQYVIINVRDGEIEVHENPTRERYTSSRTVSSTGTLELRVSATASLSIPAARVLP